MIPVDAAALQAAVLAGARRHARKTGKVYSRRHLTSKQRRLIGLLADGDGIGFEDLVAAFPEEWGSVAKAHPERTERVNRRSFFQNVADLAGRINSYLVAGYEETPLGGRLVSSLGERFVGLAVSYDMLEVTPVSTEDLDELRSQIHLIDGNEHVPRRRRSVTAPMPVDEPRSGPIEPAPEPSLPDPVTAPAPEPPSPPAPLVEIGPAPPPVAGPSDEPVPPPVVAPADPAPLPSTDERLEAQVDRVSGRWSLRIRGLPVDVDPRLGLLFQNGQLIRWPADPLPLDPEDATFQQVRLLLSLLS